MALDLTEEAQEALRFAQTYGCSAEQLARSLKLTEGQARKVADEFCAKYPGVQLFREKSNDGKA